MSGTESTQYDAYNRILTQTNALNQSTQYAYDDTLKSITVTTPEGIVTQRFLNEHGEVIRLVDGKGRETAYQYDNAGNLVGQIDDKGTQSWKHDALGNLLESQDIYGTLVTYQYDSESRRLTRIDDPSTHNGQVRDGARNLATTYTYNAFSDVVQTTDSRGVITDYQFDAKSQLLTETSTDAAGIARTTEYVYNGVGNQVNSKDAEQGITRQHYDNLGRMVASENGLGGISHYVYNDHSQVQFSIDALGAVVEYSYDLNGNRLSAVPDTHLTLPTEGHDEAYGGTVTLEQHNAAAG